MKNFQLIIALLLCVGCSTNKVSRKQTFTMDSLRILVTDTFFREQLKSVNIQKKMLLQQVLFTPPDSSGKQYIQAITVLDTQSEEVVTETEHEQQLQSAIVTGQTTQTYQESKEPKLLSWRWILLGIIVLAILSVWKLHR